uniref:EB domain-containing protein n=1 Tax=Strongyloides venezuelensis TaxID=75913 RepID=A0A0K0FLH2_STRVS
MDFDDFSGFQLLGCKNNTMKTCKGNACYMRHHKNYGFFLFTSGCLNLTFNDLITINNNQNIGKNVRYCYGNETTVCEMNNKTGTCICSNNLCNEVEEAQYFSEYESSLFENINFNEISHYKYYLPNDPILQDYELRNRQAGRKKTDKPLLYEKFISDSGEKKNFFLNISKSNSWKINSISNFVIIYLIKILLIFLY